MRDQRRDEMSIVGPTHISDVPTTTHKILKHRYQKWSQVHVIRAIYLHFVLPVLLPPYTPFLMLPFWNRNVACEFYIFIEFH